MVVMNGNGYMSMKLGLWLIGGTLAISVGYTGIVHRILDAHASGEQSHTKAAQATARLEERQKAVEKSVEEVKKTVEKVRDAQSTMQTGIDKIYDVVKDQR